MSNNNGWIDVVMLTVAWFLGFMVIGLCALVVVGGVR